MRPVTNYPILQICEYVDKHYKTIRYRIRQMQFIAGRKIDSHIEREHIFTTR